MSVALFGIRHHGPGSARALDAALASLAPDVVLVELPRDTEPALRWIADDDLVPPVALLGYAVAEPARSVFLPLAGFSPEWRAARYAARHGVPLRPIDLAVKHMLAAGPDESLTADAAMVVDPIGALAAAAGDPDPERWWDDVIEHRGDGEPAFAAVADAMSAVRAGAPPPSIGEVRREATMRAGIRAAIGDGFRRIAVVCGAWHVPALDLEHAPSAAADAATVRGLPSVKAAVTWVPWTDERLTRTSGYGAGVLSPAWYAHVDAHPGPDRVSRWFVDAARLLRDRGMATSPDHLIAGARMADTLAALRGRPRPGLAEVLDAASAVLGEGGEGALALVRRSLVVGEGIGRVPEGAPLVPLARDLAAEQRRCRMRPVSGVTDVELDLRTPLGRNRSQLLHRTRALGLGWAELTEGRGSSGTFRESWRVAWSPEIEIRVIELSVLGSTLASSAAARIGARAAAATTLADIVTALDDALLCHLPEAVEPCVHMLSTRCATDPDVGHLMDVLGPLGAATRYGDVRATDAASLCAALDGIVVRVIAGVAPACASLNDEAAAAMAERLASTHAALALVDHPARATEWPRVLGALADGRGIHGLVQGRATRLVHDAGAWTSARVAARLSRALSVGTPPAVGAAFVEGFLAGSGAVLIHDTALLAVVDEWLSALPADGFVAVTPLLRRTFGAFEPAERRLIGEHVARGRATPPAELSSDLDPERTLAGLSTVRLMLGIDRAGVNW